MAKNQKQPAKTCADCIHESACRMWAGGRFISDASASVCPNHKTVNESAAYLCGVLDERKRKQSNADHIRTMSDFELAKEIENAQSGIEIKNPKNIDYFDCILEWLHQPTEEYND